MGYFDNLDAIAVQLDVLRTAERDHLASVIPDVNGADIDPRDHGDRTDDPTEHETPGGVHYDRGIRALRSLINHGASIDLDDGTLVVELRGAGHDGPVRIDLDNRSIFIDQSGHLYDDGARVS